MLTLWTWDSEAGRGRLAFLQSEIKKASHAHAFNYIHAKKMCLILLKMMVFAHLSVSQATFTMQLDGSTLIFSHFMLLKSQ